MTKTRAIAVPAYLIRALRVTWVTYVGRVRGDGFGAAEVGSASTPRPAVMKPSHAEATQRSHTGGFHEALVRSGRSLRAGGDGMQEGRGRPRRGVLRDDRSSGRGRHVPLPALFEVGL